MTEIAPDIIAAAQSSERATGIPASVSIAQYGDESGWGKHEPVGSNNPFGIKALPGQPFVMAMTTEYVGGKPIREPQPFRKFASIADAFVDHAELLATAPVYAPARALLPDVDAFVRAMAVHYATAPDYAAIILGIIKSNNLEQYDVAPSPVLDPVVMPVTGAGIPDEASINTRTGDVTLTSAPVSPPAPLAKPTPQPVVTPVRVAATVGAVGVAVAGAGALTQMHGVDLTPIVTPIISTAGLILSGFAAWALQRVAAYAHLSMQSALMQNLLGVVDRSITYGQNQATKLAAADATINVPTEAEAQALQYVVNKAPGTAKALGIDVTTLNGQQHIADLITAKLPPPVSA